MDIDDSQRLLAITTPLGKNALWVDELTGSEYVSNLFQFSLRLVSENGNIDFSKLVGKSATVRIKQPDGTERYWNGVISRLAQVAADDTLFHYHAELVPWLWFLQYTEDCRIFQQKSVPDIIEKVLKDRGFTDFKSVLSARYSPRDYCVQYRETDLAFISRLMEEEGIFYYFEHDDGKHTLVLSDAASSAKPCPVKSTLPFRTLAGSTEGDDITTWMASLTIVPEKISLQDYNFAQPTTDLLASSPSMASQAKQSQLDLYDYHPGRYTTVSDGERYAKIMMERFDGEQARIQGEGECRTLAAGYSFTLSKHFREECNGEYFLLTVHHNATNNLPWNGRLAKYSNQFLCQSKQTSYRPARLHTKPNISGVQSATVVGPKDEEIYTDKYGRVKIQFPWDRIGKNNDQSSCWVRVSQAWAGVTWGTIHIPRVGQEVLVEFLEGDPDQPIITGRVYNAQKMPPYELPTNNTQSGIKTRSSPKGSADNFNELRFEDKKGAEDIYFQAEKDFHRNVKNDDDLQVGHNRTTTIKNDRTTTINEGNDTLTLAKGSQTVAIQQGNANFTVEQGTRTVTIAGNDSHTVTKGNFLLTVQEGSKTEVIDKGDASVEVKQGNASFTVSKGTHTLTVEGDDSHVVKTGNRTVTVNTGNDTQQIKQGNRSVEVSLGNDTLTVKEGNQTTQISLGKSETEAMQSIVLKVGQSSIKIDPSGVTIAGMTVTLQGQMEAQVTAPMTSVKATGILTLQGTLAKIN